MNRLQISYFLPGRGRNGGIHSTVTACNLLRQRGHHVTLYVYKGDKALKTKIQFYKIYTNRVTLAYFVKQF